MAGKGKGKRGKAKTTSKSTAKAGKGSASVSKMTKAANKCCPLIKWKCENTPVLLPKKDWTEGHWTGGHEQGDWVATKTYKHVTKCWVQSGGSKKKTGLDPAQKDDAVNKLKDALAAKRCIAVEAPTE